MAKTARSGKAAQTAAREAPKQAMSTASGVSSSPSTAATNRLTNSIPRVPKATYVPLQVSAPLPDVGRAIQKFGYVRQLNLQPGEVNAVQKSLATLAAVIPASVMTDENFLSTLRTFEGERPFRRNFRPLPCSPQYVRMT